MGLLGVRYRTLFGAAYTVGEVFVILDD